MKTREFKAVDLLAAFVIIGVLAAMLVPVFRQVKSAQSSRCQSNMHILAKAVRMYLSDWEDKYPTNRTRSGSAVSSIIMPTVRLSDPDVVDTNGNPVLFQYGFNWVEGLYPYVQNLTTDNYRNVYKCPAAYTVMGPNTGRWAGVSYAFNSNLIEQSTGRVRDANKLMMIREMDRLYDSILKPQGATPTASPMPIDPFLAKMSNPVGLNVRLHDEGSHILFADGHVKGYPVSYFPTSGQWCSATNRWYNYVGGVSASDPRYRSIAITP